MFKSPVTVQSATEFLQNHFTVHTENQTSGSSLLNEFEVLQSTKKYMQLVFKCFYLKKERKKDMTNNMQDIFLLHVVETSVCMSLVYGMGLQNSDAVRRVIVNPSS